MPTDLFDHELERAVVAGLAEASQLDARRALLLADQAGLARADFHLPAHQELFEIVQGLLRAGRPADQLSVRTALPRVDRALLEQTVWESGSSEYALPGHAATLQDMALRRRLVAMARELASKAEDPTLDATTTVSRCAASLAAVGQRATSARGLDDVLGDVARERAQIQDGGATVLPTGLLALDAVIGGLQPTLTVVGAHPGVGKSAFLAAIIKNQAHAGRVVGVFSLEDQATWLAWRYLAAESGLDQFVLRTRPLRDDQHEQLGRGFTAVHNYAGRILVDDRTGLAPRDVVQAARDLVLNRGAKALFVDHVGELRYENRRSDRHDLDVAEGLSDLRGLAKQYGVPVVCATHLRREAADPPRLFDFANAAAIERQARVALALTRPPDCEELTVSVLKHTNGKAGLTIKLPFLASAALVGEGPGVRR